LHLRKAHKTRWKHFIPAASKIRKQRERRSENGGSTIEDAWAFRKTAEAREQSEGIGMAMADVEVFLQRFRMLPIF
jgi:hypothetical protein